VWAYRELLYFFVWRDVKIRYKQTAIGVLWVILQPVLNMLVFTLFFGRLAKLPSDGLPYPVFYFAALVPWTYFSYSLSSTTNVVVENQRLITKVYFPRLILPISTALSGLVDFAIGFAVLSIFCFAYGIRPTLAALWLPILLLLALFTALGVGLWLSALNALYRDVRYVMTFLVQFWMFASPVMASIPWPASLTASDGQSRAAATLPACFFSLPPSPSRLSSSAACSSSIAWRRPLPIASSTTIVIRGFTSAMPLLFKQGSFSSFIDRYAGWPACARLELDEFLLIRPSFACHSPSSRSLAGFRDYDYRHTS
ncbi:MAG: hypothetical protein DMG41_36450, partial [Acidobacteria bacterium]